MQVRVNVDTYMGYLDDLELSDEMSKSLSEIISPDCSEIEIKSILVELTLGGASVSGFIMWLIHEVVPRTRTSADFDDWFSIFIGQQHATGALEPWECQKILNVWLYETV